MQSGKHYTTIETAKLDHLKDENFYLKSLLAIPRDGYPESFSLTPNECFILTYLRTARSITSVDKIKELIDNEGDSNISRVYMCRLRKKLAPYGVKVDNVYGIGYRIGFKYRQRLNDVIARLLEEENASF